MIPTLHVSPKRHVTFLLSLVAVSFFFYAYSTGITGMTQLNGNGCTCHNPTATAEVTVSIVGPDSLSPGQVGSYSVTISGGPLVRGGTNISVSTGTLSTILGSGLQKIGAELTHTTPKLPSSGTVTFAFNYTAPSVIGTVTMYANGNSVNLSGDNTGDEWNFAPNKSIVIRDVVPVELTSFAATTSGSDVTVQWSTATETNNKGFEVERAAVVNGVQTEFSNIAFIAGKGTTTEIHSYSYTDRSLVNGVYAYRIKQVDYDGTFAFYNLSSEVDVNVPAEYTLAQNFPNPFNPSTRINFSLMENSFVSLRVFNVVGQEVAELINTNMLAGTHSIDFKAEDFGLTSGVYIYTIDAGSYKAARKMILSK